jgi:hypothetical protein
MSWQDKLYFKIALGLKSRAETLFLLDIQDNGQPEREAKVIHKSASECLKNQRN